MNEGWKCPQCGKIYAPWVPSCEACIPVPATTVIPPYIPSETQTPTSPPWYGIPPKVTCGGVNIPCGTVPSFN